jgi:hypothetical protein
LALVGVDGVLPGDQFRVEDVEVLDAPVEALAGQSPVPLRAAPYRRENSRWYRP